jgi:hypothetical protein
MNPLTQNNPYPLHFLTKLSFFVIGSVKWKDTKFILTTKKEQCVRNQLPLKFEVYGGRPIYPSSDKVIILDFEIKLFFHCFVAFGLERGFINI